ncbi:RES family NAD+ phosphorylase [Methylocystis sp.]|uniref:RES family NAD+ phosphorylase n=1 Tax=Methylocystis sp. TaxID=1911079 RepID=UPI0027333136|nr:RES family NAD+ phosphorylase [Methylocystis sp.]MDP3554477.1 RES family NAD+ phosphorylase [Methylocystis sp.]
MPVACASVFGVEGLDFEGYMPNSEENNEPKICTKCIGNTYFVEWIVQNGVLGECSFDISHGRMNPVVTIEAFAEEVGRYFRENYQRGEEYMYFTHDSDNASYDTHGEPYKDILASDLECDEHVVDAVAENLPDCSWHDISQGDESFYDECANYESIDVAESRQRADEEGYWYENRFTYQWNDFCRTVQFNRRFFKTKELLDSLFGKPEEYHEGPVKPIYNLELGTKIFRARVLDDVFTENRLVENPAAELGAPPSRLARAGRMNVEYIPAFYGAFSQETALAELRPSIGDEVAIGEFFLREALRVFDFTIFSKKSDTKRKDFSAHTRYDFIAQMENEISKPIRPFEKQREYIATQIVTEYLREYFECDAVVYRSSLHKNTDIDNRNIVIFSKGREFVGQGQALMLSGHRIATVEDVLYRTFFNPF